MKNTSDGINPDEQNKKNLGIDSGINISVDDTVNIEEILNKRDFFVTKIKDFLGDEIDDDFLRRSYLLNMAYYYLNKIPNILGNLGMIRQHSILLEGCGKGQSHDFKINDKDKIKIYLEKNKNKNLGIYFSGNYVEVISIIDVEILSMRVKKLYMSYKETNLNI